MKVHEIMTAHAKCVSPENSLVEAAGLMRELDVGALPVCEDDRLVGMVTDRDLAVRGVALGRDPQTTLVRDVMTPGVAYVSADTAVEDAARLMQERGIRRLPVLNRESRLVGIVALADLAITSHPAFAGFTLREVSHPVRPNGRDRRREMLGLAAGAGRRPPAGDGQRDGARNGAGESGEPGARRRRAPAAKTTKRSSAGRKRQPARSTGSRQTTGTRGRAKRS